MYGLVGVSIGLSVVYGASQVTRNTCWVMTITTKVGVMRKERSRKKEEEEKKRKRSVELRELG